MISDLNKLGIALKSLETMNIGTVGTNLGNIEAYRTALKGLSVEQSVFALASKGATEEQIRQILVTDQSTAKDVEAAMAKAGLTTATKSLTQAEMVEIATHNGVAKATAEELLSKIGITATEEGQIAVKKQVTRSMLEQAVASGTLTKAEASQIATMLGLNAAETTSIGLTNVLTASFTKLWAVITAHPIGAILTAIGAIAVGTIAYINKTNKEAEEALVEAHESAQQALDDTKTSLSEDQSELQSVNSELETTKERLKELASIGAPTLTEQNELTKLSTANAQLEAQQTLLENNIKLKQKAAALDAKELLNTQTELKDYTLSDDGTVVENVENYDYKKAAELNAFNLKEAYNIYIKAIKDGNVEAQNEAQTLVDSVSGESANLTSELLDIDESFKYDDGTIIEGYEDIYNEYMGMIYNLQSLTDPDTFFDIAESVTSGTGIDYEKAISEAYALAYEGNFDIASLNQDFVKALADAGIDESTIYYIFSLKQQEYQMLIDKINTKYDSSKTYSLGGDSEDTKNVREEVDKVNQELNNYAKENPIEFQLIASYDNNFTLLDKYIDEEKSKAENNADYVGDYVANAISRIYEEASKMSEESSDETSILSTEELEEQIDSLNSAIDEIQSAYNTLTSAVEEYNSQGYLSLDTLQSLLDMDDAYLACLVNENGQLTLNADTMNALAQAKLSEAEATAVSQAMTELDAIAKGEATTATANYITGNASLMKSLELLAGQYDNVANAAMTAAQAQALSAAIEEANAKDSVATANVTAGLNAKLGLIRSTASSIKTKGLSTVSSSGSKSSSSSSSSKDAWKEEFEAQYDLLKHNLEMEYITEEQYYSALNALNEKYFANNAKYTDEYRKYQEEVYKGMQQVYKDYIENNMSYLEKALDANKISFGHYSNAVKKMLDDMWHEGKISAEEYWSYVQKMLEKQLDIYDATLSAVTDLLDDEIDKLQDEVDALNDKNDALNDQLEIYDSALSAIEKVYDDEIQKLEDQKQAIQDVIDAMQEENDERERAMALQQAQYNLNRALSQNANYIYKDGQFVYTTDQTAIREAQDSLHEAQYNIDIAELQKQQDALDDYIDVLNSYKNLWSEIAEAYQTAQDSINATAILGANYAQLVLSNNLSDIENFKNQYVEIQSQINSNDELIASYEEKIKYYENLKEQWSSVADVYEKEQNRIYASQVLGAQWESDVLNGRIDTLTNFKNQYVALQQAIADAAVASANAIVQANQNAANSAMTASASISSGSGSSSGGGSSSSASEIWYVKGSSTGKIYYSGDKASAKKVATSDPYTLTRVDNTNHIYYVGVKSSSSSSSKGGSNHSYSAYASGTTNAKKGLNLVGEDGTETYIDNDGNVSLVTVPSLINMEGGETVKNAKETEELLNPNNFVPVETMELPGLNGQILKMSSNEFMERMSKVMPSYSSMVQSAIQTPKYGAIPVNRNNNATITQQVTFNCPNLTDKSGIEYVERELQSLATRAMQFDWSK